MSLEQPTLGAPLALDDGELLAEMVSGSPEAFDELYHRFYARARRVAWSVCRDAATAEDAVQEGFIAVWRHAGSYRSELGTVAAWLLSVVRYRAIDVARANSKHAAKLAGEEQPVPHPVSRALADEVVERDTSTSLRARLRLLPDAQRQVVTLAFYGQLSHSEIAAKLQLPPGTVKGRMRLGLQRLRDDIEGAGAAERLRTALTNALRVGDVERARRVVREAINEMPAVTMLDDVLAPAMRSIGALWQAAEITVADEHLATTICRQLLDEIAATLQTAPVNSRQTVLLITPEPERHELALVMAGAVLSGAGYDTLLLGSGVPQAALKSALLRHRPAVVALSSSVPRAASLAAAAKLVHETLPAVHLITGGAAARALPLDITAHYVERLDGLLGTVDALLVPPDRPRALRGLPSANKPEPAREGRS